MEYTINAKKELFEKVFNMFSRSKSNIKIVKDFFENNLELYSRILSTLHKERNSKKDSGFDKRKYSKHYIDVQDFVTLTDEKFE